MSNTIQFKRGNGVGGTLLEGEPAFDLSDGSLYVGDGTDNIMIGGTLTSSPVITITTTVNENGSVDGSYTSVVGSTTVIEATSGTISNHDEVAKTFTYTAYDIVDDLDGVDTIIGYSAKLGQLQSANDTVNMTIIFVDIEADTAVTPDGSNFTLTNITYA